MVSTLDTNLLEEKMCLNDMGSLVSLICGGVLTATTILTSSFDILLSMDDLVTNG